LANVSFDREIVRAPQRVIGRRLSHPDVTGQARQGPSRGEHKRRA
jgi:hypothetical protein